MQQPVVTRAFLREKRFVIVDRMPWHSRTPMLRLGNLSITVTVVVVFLAIAGITMLSRRHTQRSTRLALYSYFISINRLLVDLLLTFRDVCCITLPN